MLLKQLIRNIICSISPHCNDESENEMVMNNNALSFIIEHVHRADMMAETTIGRQLVLVK